MLPTASHFLKLLSTECTDPARAELTMKSTTKQLLRRNKSILKRNFLDKLMKKGLGTNKAEKCARSLAQDCCDRNGEGRERLRKKFLYNIMKLKKTDADEIAKVEEQKY